MPPPCKYSAAALLSPDGWRYHLASSVAPSGVTTLRPEMSDFAGNWLRFVVEVPQHGVEGDAAAGDVSDRRGRRRAVQGPAGVLTHAGGIALSISMALAEAGAGAAASLNVPEVGETWRSASLVAGKTPSITSRPSVKSQVVPARVCT
jgi:hypothetical protein